ncbi:MAG: hypothetical protein ACYC99_08935 [Candidatus Geothermincolia bacterium]
MRLQRREGGTVHHGHRLRAKGGYAITCRRKKLVPFSGWKRTEKAVNCPVCLRLRADYKALKKQESLARKAL